MYRVSLLKSLLLQPSQMQNSSCIAVPGCFMRRCETWFFQTQMLWHPLDNRITKGNTSFGHSVSVGSKVFFHKCRSLENTIIYFYIKNILYILYYKYYKWRERKNSFPIWQAWIIHGSWRRRFRKSPQNNCNCRPHTSFRIGVHYHLIT